MTILKNREHEYNDSLKTKEYYMSNKTEGDFVANYIFLEDDERNLLNLMSSYIECGYTDYIEKIQNKTGLTKDEIIIKIEIIKEKIANSEYMKLERKISK